jgi:hypothetical protein
MAPYRGDTPLSGREESAATHRSYDGREKYNSASCAQIHHSTRMKIMGITGKHLVPPATSSCIETCGA